MMYRTIKTTGKRSASLGKSKNTAKKQKHSHKNIKDETLEKREADALEEMCQIPSSESKGMKSKSKNTAKKQKHSHRKIKDETLEKREVDALEEVYQIPSLESKGMKKWIMEYHQGRPGLTILQQRIDDFITEHEAQQEQAKKERESHLEEGGWTVVSHHKGRKKTTDPETGLTVGSVAPAVVMDKMAKKKTNEASDFYRFQKREAQRNEHMKLLSKFEDDKKRIRELRSARKFKPY